MTDISANIGTWFGNLANTSRQRSAASDIVGFRGLLILRFAIANIAGFSLLGAFYLNGFVAAVRAGDSTGLSIAIFVAFLAGNLLCALRIWRVSAELDGINGDADLRQDSWTAEYLAAVDGREASSRGLLVSALQSKISARIVVVRHVANSLVLLGLIGTVIGFIIALSGVDPETVADVDKIAPMVGELIRGMSVALYTTLVGAIFSLWLTVNYQILAGGAVTLVAAIVRRGEAHAAS